MNNKKWINYTKRLYLKDILPLDTPIALQIEPSRACNLRCVYCCHYNSKSKVNSLSQNEMEYSLFEKFISSLKEFSKPIQVITFCGLGEPLINKNIVEMVRLAKSVCKDVRIISNGILLTPELSDKLVSAGLNYIRISLQGVCAEDYLKTCGAKIDFQKFVNNLKYFYDNRKDCKLCLKITDLSIKTAEKEALFHKIYKPICDNLEVQTIKPLSKDIDYKEISTSSSTVYNDNFSSTIVCPQPFYQLMILANGQVSPCCNVYSEHFYLVGDITKNSLFQIWNSDKLQNLRIMQLKNMRHLIKQCKNCEYLKSYINEYDFIDKEREDLLKLYEK